MDHSSKISEKELAELCARSDPNALKTLYFRYAAELNALCYRYVSDEEDAMDLTHDIMIHVYGNIHKFRWSGEGSLGGWIRRIAVNLSIDRLRRQKRLKFSKAPLNIIENRPEDNDEVSDLERISGTILLGMIASLPDIQRTVFNLYCLDGFSHKEIAEILGIAENSSSSALSRARDTLKKLIRKHLDFDL